MWTAVQEFWRDWGAVFLLLEIIWVAFLSTWIILERRSPAATLAWIFGLSLLPLVGAGVFWLLGPRRLQRRRFRYNLARQQLVSLGIPMRRAGGEIPELPCPYFAPLAEMMCRLGEPPPTQLAHLEVITDGDACFAAIEAAILGARHQIHIEYYIWEPDPIGLRLRDRLVEKAKEGVEIRLLLDSVGSGDLKANFFAPLRQAGVRIAKFNPFRLVRWRRSLVNFRTHRKIIVVDGQIGFTGGMNVSGNHCASQHQERAWHDVHLRLEGEAVRWLQMVFIENWHFTTGDTPSPSLSFPRLPPSDPAPAYWVQIISSGPDSDARAIHRMIIAAICRAEKRLFITTPYFVPDEPLLQALTSAAWRGVDVRLLVPVRGDSRLVTAAARSYFDELAAAGVKVFEYMPAMLHAKSIVVDNDLVLTGTANLDNRSFRLNFELMVAIYNHGVAGQFSRLFKQNLAAAQPYGLRQSRHVPFYQRLLESAARLFSPSL
jgi:cardiolipin synthase